MTKKRKFKSNKVNNDKVKKFKKNNEENFKLIDDYKNAELKLTGAIKEIFNLEKVYKSKFNVTLQNQLEQLKSLYSGSEHTNPADATATGLSLINANNDVAINPADEAEATADEAEATAFFYKKLNPTVKIETLFEEHKEKEKLEALFLKAQKPSSDAVNKLFENDLNNTIVGRVFTNFFGTEATFQASYKMLHSFIDTIFKKNNEHCSLIAEHNKLVAEYNELITAKYKLFIDHKQFRPESTSLERYLDSWALGPLAEYNEENIGTIAEQVNTKTKKFNDYYSEALNVIGDTSLLKELSKKSNEITENFTQLSQLSKDLNHVKLYEELFNFMSTGLKIENIIEVIISGQIGSQNIAPNSTEHDAFIKEAKDITARFQYLNDKKHLAYDAFSLIIKTRDNIIKPVSYTHLTLPTKRIV